MSFLFLKNFVFSCFIHVLLLFFIIYSFPHQQPEVFKVSLHLEQTTSAAKKIVNQPVQKPTTVPTAKTSAKVSKTRNKKISAPKIKIQDLRKNIIIDKPKLTIETTNKPALEYNKVSDFFSINEKQKGVSPSQEEKKQPQQPQQTNEQDLVTNVLQEDPLFINEKKKYQSILAVIVNKNWKTPLVQKKEAFITVDINKNGEIINYKFSKNSGVFSFDSAVEKSILSSVPFPKIPAVLNIEFFRARFHFTNEGIQSSNSF